jgi:hypothetical protein
MKKDYGYFCVHVRVTSDDEIEFVDNRIKKEDVTKEDIRDMANELTEKVGDEFAIDEADKEALYDDLKSVLAKYLID